MSDGESGVAGGLRRAMLALTVLSILGLLLELVLLEHYDSAWQWTPLIVLAVALIGAAVVARRPAPRTIRLFRVLMVFCVVAGVLGLWLHYRGNVEFERERDPNLRGLALFWEAIRGATPALAPGAMAQLGLLGLAFTYRHPALSRPTTVRGVADTASPEDT